MEIKDNKIVLSESEIKIYQYFNVCSQESEIKKMCDEDKFIILFICSKGHEVEETIDNFRPFRDIFVEISKHLDSEKSSLYESVKSLYGIDDFNKMVSSFMLELPKRFTEIEAKRLRREININTILE